MGADLCIVSLGTDCMELLYRACRGIRIHDSCAWKKKAEIFGSLQAIAW